MRVWILIGVAVLLAGCGTNSAIGYPDGSGSYVVMRTITDPSPFAATQQRNFMERCRTKTEDGYTDCSFIVAPNDRHTSAPGYIAGPLQYALPSAAGAYAGYAIGQGLKGSGDTVTNNTQSGAGASAQNQNSQQQRNFNNNESFNGKGYQW